MTVEERKGSAMGTEDGAARDQFPVGMRVLAVDDDPTCLKLLETLLIRCQYHVTTTSQAIKALQMLRENKDRFDLVISDVHMPDMDGFKLLELVGLEMDLPVIMLSANGDTQMVMKGISHGACDYLLKPVRIEELKNIWQHVVRRRRFDSQHSTDLDGGDAGQKTQPLDSSGEHGAVNRDKKLNNKRKEQNGEDDDGDSDENSNEGDSGAQKKPKTRVVWSVELHRKFVAAVNQLGIDKAVPKKILDIMNEEKLTRENVASHLQKYRLYLKRLSAVTSQQQNLAAVFGVRSPSYINMNSLESFKNYHALGRYRQLPTVASVHSNGFFTRMNSPSAFGGHSLLPTQGIQLAHIQNNSSKNSNNSDQMKEPNKCFPACFSTSRLVDGVSRDSCKMPMPMQSELLNNYSSTRALPSDLDPLKTLARPNNSWQSPVPSKPPADSLNHEDVSVSQLNRNMLGEPSSSFTVAFPSNPMLGNGSQYRTMFCGNKIPITSFDNCSASFGFKCSSNTIRAPGEQEHDHSLNANLMFGSTNSSLLDPVPPNQIAGSVISRTTLGYPVLTHNGDSIDRSASVDQTVNMDEYSTGATKVQSDNYSVEDLLNAVYKADREHSMPFMDEDMGCDLYSLSA